MIIAVGDAKVYKFPSSTIACEIHNGYIEIIVTPERRRFIIRPKPDKMKRLQEAHQQTYQHIATTLIVDSLRNGFIQTDEEII